MEANKKEALSVKLFGHDLLVLYDETRMQFTFKVTFSNSKDAVASLSANVPVSNKRLRKEDQGEEPKRKRAKKKREEGEVTIDVLPVEILQNILAEVCEDKVMRVVCRSVCRIWREVTISPPLNHSPFRPCSEFAKHTISEGWVSIFRWAIEHGCIWDDKALIAAIELGNIEMLKLVRSRKKSEEWYNYKVNLKNLVRLPPTIEAINWLREDGCPFLWKAVAKKAAQTEGRLHILKWVFSKKHQIKKLDINKIFQNAAKGGSLEAMKWLKEKDVDNLIKVDEKNICDTVPIHKREALMWLRDMGCHWNEKMFAKAVRIGDLESMIWLKENGCPCTGYQITFAFENLVSGSRVKDLKVLKWAQENGYQWNGESMSRQARDFEVIKWLKEEGGGGWYPRREVVTYAAETGSIENVKWAIDNGCAFDNPSLMGTAISKGNLDMVKYLWQKGHHRNPNICDVAARQGQLEILQWLREQGCEWHHTVNAAIGRGQLSILQWAIASGCPVDEDSYDYWKTAASISWQDHQSYDMMKWLIEKDLIKCDEDSNIPWKQLASAGAVEMLDFLKGRAITPYWNKFTYWAAKYSSIDSLNWCRENWSKHTLLGALKARSPAAVRFIYHTHPDVKHLVTQFW